MTSDRECINCGVEVRPDYDVKLEVVRLEGSTLYVLESWPICPDCDVPQGGKQSILSRFVGYQLL